MNIENCPCCPKHCQKSNLNCGRGEEYFKQNNYDNSKKDIFTEIIVNLQKCGHFFTSQ